MKKKTPPPKKVKGKVETTDAMPEAAQAAQPFTAAGKVQPAGCALHSASSEVAEGRYMQPSSPREKLARELDMLIRRESSEDSLMEHLSRRFQETELARANTRAEIKIVRWQLANT